MPDPIKVTRSTPAREPWEEKQRVMLSAHVGNGRSIIYQSASSEDQHVDTLVVEGLEKSTHVSFTRDAVGDTFHVSDPISHRMEGALWLYDRNQNGRYDPDEDSKFGGHNVEVVSKAVIDAFNRAMTTDGISDKERNALNTLLERTAKAFESDNTLTDGEAESLQSAASKIAKGEPLTAPLVALRTADTSSQHR